MKLYSSNKWIALLVVFSGLVFCSTFSATAQDIEVSGTVIDATTDQTLPGVNIAVQGTSRGTATDADGNYSIEVPSDATLVFTFIGYAEQVVPVNGRQEINVALEPGVNQLGEVVAVGYATQEAGEVTGSISSVSSEDLEDVSVVNTSSALKGAVSGVTAVESSTPGEGASIRIRGLTTINDNEPLWVVDGVPGAPVNPENIESISILKDAASQAIYGARASNGVVLVTTKSGRKDQPVQVNVKVRNGITQNANSYNLLNTQEYGEMLWLQAKNDGNDPVHPQYGSGDEPAIPDYILPAGTNGEVDESLYDRQMVHQDGDDTFIIMRANKQGTDWMDEIERNAVYQEYSVGLNGGSETTNYAFQAGYLKEEGILKYTGYNRYNLRSNVSVDVNDWLSVGEKVGLTYSEDYGNQSNNNEATVISHTYRMQPIVPVYDIKGAYAGTRASNTGNGTNPLWSLDMNQHDQTNGLNLSGNAFAEADILENLSFKSLVGFNYNTADVRNYSYVEVAFAERGKYDGLGEFASFSTQWNWTNTLNYSKTFADVHDITLMAGTEAIQNNYRWRNGSRENFFSRDPLYMQLNSGVQNQINGGNESQWNLFSMFSRVNYAYDQKYLLEAVVRRDGSSRFGEENRYGTFPAFSAAWRITNEEFMSSTENWLDYLMVRVGYGMTGNDRIGNYNSYTTYASSQSNSFYPIAGANIGPGSSGFYRASLGNDNVQWEITTTTNIGIDATIFSNWDLSVDLWNRVTSDMLYPQRIPDVLGQAAAPSINVGEMENNGIDVEVGYNGTAMDEELQYGISLNVSHYKNKVNRLSSDANEFMEGSSFRQMNYTRAETGTQFPEFYGYVIEGIFQTQEEADNHPAAFGEGGDYNEPGRFKYKDVNGDGVITADDRTYIGDPHPLFTSGLNLNMSYKGFRASTRFYTSYGNDMVNYVRRWIDFNQFQGNRSERRLYESWGSPYLANNANATMPKAEGNDTDSQYPSTYFMEDASYLRMEQLHLSYDLNSILNVQNVRNLRLYIQANNLFTITNYSGLDPEVNAGGINRGIDRGAWPTSRRLMFGVDIGL
ncbi:SusC/RagA family TonB-linked outer membrane protein [Fodinibius sediminis]|uniref:TonB-linked outer membrane protein, SusC/RagA family n=1 Tax=Fodinibius sediminis TaxID=1214077 RepID=A0A521D4J5_9BACT|nr:TonB-dependent receptor [Fodinibius sediminis]SMO66633.1 TonB-linked outer membrane protein, SusC/RagA family [Fodinibius sediminis]